MNPKKTQRLASAFPHMFRYMQHKPGSVPMPIAFGIECEDGWFGLIYHLCEDIQTELDKHKGEEWADDFCVVQMKEKYAMLRYYIGSGNVEIHDLISEAETRSATICEVCGEPGVMCDHNGWFKTVCINHREIVSRWGRFKGRVVGHYRPCAER